MKRIDKNKLPNPYFAREKTYLLNGEWEFEMNHDDSIPDHFSSNIIVPFAPETKDSGIEKTITKNDILHYHLELNYDEDIIGKKIRLVFQAVDQVSDLYFNRIHKLHHEGGYLPFSLVIEEAKKGDTIDLTVKDDTDSTIYPKGKQTLHPHGMFYHATSGIWGDVYLEILPKGGHIDDFFVQSDFDNKKIYLKNIHLSNKEDTLDEGYLLYEGKMVQTLSFDSSFDLKECFHPWSTFEPSLYEIELHYKDDIVTTSFGVRKFEIKNYKDIKLFYLNNHAIYLNGLLDQGYHSPTGGMTPPSEGLVLKDLQYVKDCGFNFLRKHIKVESPRWYYLCDKLGIVVMQDFVSTGDRYNTFRLAVLPTIGFLKGKKNANANRSELNSQKFFEQEMPIFVDHFKNYTSVCLWCLFNEGWGQFDATRLTEKLRSLDPIRPIDSTSGWFDEGAGDIDSKHVYFRKPRLKNKKDRVLFLSEFGGFALKVPGHVFTRKSFGYKILSSQEELTRWLEKTYLKQIVPLIEKQGLCGTVYTQLSDVEDEINGLVTYDRAVYKVPASQMFSINQKVYSAFEKFTKE